MVAAQDPSAISSGANAIIVGAIEQLHLVFQMDELAFVVITEDRSKAECVGCTNGKEYTAAFWLSECSVSLSGGPLSKGTKGCIILGHNWLRVLLLL